MKKIVLLLLAAFVFGAITTKTSAQIYMAAGQENVKYINFQEVKSLKMKNSGEETILFTKNSLLPQKVQGSSNTNNCSCDLSSPSYLAAMAVNLYGDIITMNMLGTQVYIALKNGKMQTIDIENPSLEYSEQALYARMTSTPDGSIYALNNAGTQLIRIDKNERIEFLGAIEGFSAIFAADAEKRASYGGDMIADQEGNLYVFTAFGYVVKINPQTLVSEYVGRVSNLPEGYTVNAAAVTDDNKIVLASSQPKGLYYTDLNGLQASFAGENTTPTYDLASANFFRTKPQNLLTDISVSLSPTFIKQDRFFNLVSNSTINNATIAVYSAEGKLILRQTKTLDSGINKVKIDGIMSGVYIVNVIDLSGAKLLTGKITVE
ncbi:MAG: T9SS type A sorting domain-containing protein [Paludibacter sp.]|jgi:hypothetical protein|nr:T9SS type A sorting domain-containing protein [Paludibacter sp.]